MSSYLTNVTEIPGAECIGDSRVRINNNFVEFKTFLEELYDIFGRRFNLTSPVDLNQIQTIVGTNCIGESRNIIEFNTNLLKEATQHIQTFLNNYYSSIAGFSQGQRIKFFNLNDPSSLSENQEYRILTLTPTTLTIGTLQWGVIGISNTSIIPNVTTISTLNGSCSAVVTNLNSGIFSYNIVDSGINIIPQINLIEISLIPSNECVGNSRERINHNFAFLKNALIEIKNILDVLPFNFDVFAIFDTSSMLFADAEAATVALTSWHANLGEQIPNYSGDLFIVPNTNEQWVDWPRQINNKTLAIDTRTTPTNWTLIAPTYRPNYSFLPSSINKIFALAFIDETNTAYHNNVSPPNLAGEPTASFKTHYTNFISLYNSLNSSGGFFKGVTYPIVRSNLGKAFVAHGIAALYGEVLTTNQLSAIYDVSPSNPNFTNLSVLTASNPYTTAELGQNPPGLINYGWKGVWNKTSPASSVFNSSTFADELNSLL